MHTIFHDGVSPMWKWALTKAKQAEPMTKEDIRRRRMEGEDMHKRHVLWDMACHMGFNAVRKWLGQGFKEIG